MNAARSVGMLEQAEDAAGDEVGRGLEPGDQQHTGVDEQLVEADEPAVVGGVDEPGHQVVTGIGVFRSSTRRAM